LRLFAPIHQALGKGEHGAAAFARRLLRQGSRFGAVNRRFFQVGFSLVRFNQGYVPHSRNLPQYNPTR